MTKLAGLTSEYSHLSSLLTLGTFRGTPEMSLAANSEERRLYLRVKPISAK